jgi:hypothetical protein
MQFLKKTNQYIVEYTLKQAVQKLKEDDRVKLVCSCPFFENGPNKGNMMFIHTNSITPRTFKPGLSKLIKGSTGEYLIYIKEDKSIQLVPDDKGALYNEENIRLRVKIARKLGTIGCSIHPHVVGRDFGGICWGSANEDIEIISKNLDWYWVGRYALNLLEDWDDGQLNILTIAYFMFFSQLQHNSTNRQIKASLIKEIRNLYSTNKEFREQYSQGVHFFDEYLTGILVKQSEAIQK